MNVLIIGATGLVGSQLRRALIARGDTVLAHCRRPQAEQVGTHWLMGPSDRAETYTAALHEADAVINLAGTSIAQRWTERARRDILASRVATTRALGDALRLVPQKPRTWLNASAVGFYGTDETGPCDESASAGEGFLSEVCQAWEGAAIAARQHERLVLLRFGVIFASEGGVLRSLVRASKAFVGGPIGSGQQWMSWVHLQDVIRMILWSLDDHQVSGPLNVTAPNAARQADVMTKLGQLLHRPRSLPLPAGVVRFALGAMGDELLLGGQNVVPRQALARGYHHAFAGLEAALRDLLNLGQP